MSSELTASADTCFDIFDSKVFPEFNGYRVGPITKASKPPSNITSTKELDSFALLLMQNDPSKIFNCAKKVDIDQLRYFYSVYFFQYIANNGASCNNARTPQICKSSVDIAQQSFQDIIKAGECQAPASVLKSINSTSESEECIMGFGDESKQCGKL